MPWRAPSVPIPELSSQPEYEVRVAAIDVAGELPVWVWYLHAYATGAIAGPARLAMRRSVQCGR